MFAGFSRGMTQRSKGSLAALAVAGTLVVGFVDYLLGVDVSLSIFYLVPLATGTWFVGRWCGFALAVLSVVLALAGDFASGILPFRLALEIWDLGAHLVFYLVTAGLLASLRDHLESERFLARSDAVTGLLNGRAFAERLDYALGLAARERLPLTVAYLDLDDFKRINDDYGHAAGDRALKLVGATLSGVLRATDVGARVGGDEFALLLPNTDRQGAETLVERAQLAIREAFAGEPLAVTCSIGAAVFEEPPASADAAIHAADRLMYEIKGRGKDALAVRRVDAGFPPWGERAVRSVPAS